jgi:tRNA(Ile)-lysidine synthase
MLRNLFRKAATHLNSDLRDVNFEAVERLVRFVRDGASVSRKIDFTDYNHVFVEADKLLIARRSVDIPSPGWPQIKQSMELKVGQPFQLGANWRMLVQEVEATQDLDRIYTNSDPFQAWMDADLLRGHMQVRSRRNGDRFQPLGMPDGSIKLSDYFINEKLPARGRKYWPLVCLAEEIVWIPGYRSAHPYRVTASTRRLLYFSLKKGVS